MTSILKHFLLIDDNPLNNFIAKISLQNYFGEVIINAFTDPEAALAFIESEPVPALSEVDEKIIVFLDINMPSLSGWEFLEELELIDPSITEHYIIYLVSSSIDPRDLSQAQAHPYVLDFLEKPIDSEKLLKIFG